MGKRKLMSREKAEELLRYVSEHGDIKTATDYGWKMSSFRRRLREIKEHYKMIALRPLESEFEAESNRYGSRILVIGDLHEPFCRDGYLDFCKDTYKKHDCNQVIFIGDLMDNHYSSFHDTDPDGHSASREFLLAEKRIKQWYRAFPVAKVCIGNHDLIPNRRVFNAGVSDVWVRRIGDVLNVPNWEFSEGFVIDKVLYTHGTARKCRNRVKDDLRSVVQGHYHSESYIEFFVGEFFKIFGMQIGCGVDRNTYAMAYGKEMKKQHINCGVVLENGQLPILEYMKL